MYKYYGVDDKKYHIIFPLIDENEKIVDRLYGKEKLPREERSKLNQVFEENDIEIEKNLENMSTVVEFSENESHDINKLIKEDKSLGLAFQHNYVMNSDLENLIHIIREMENRPQKLVETLDKIYEKNLNLIVR